MAASDPHVTQVAVEIATHDLAGSAKVGQVPLTVVVSPETEVRAFQVVLEIIHNLQPFFEITDTLRMSGTLFFETTNVEPDWLAKQTSKKIYLVQLTLRYVLDGAIATEILYLSNHPYNTRPDEDPPNIEFIAVLQDEDIPSFTLELSDILFGIATPAFGTLKINNADGQFDNKLPQNRQWEGGAFSIKLTGDRSEIALSEGVTVCRGVMGKPQWDDNFITIELFSRQRELEKAQILSETFDGPIPLNATVGPKIFYPELYGFGQNIAPILKDEANLIYVVCKNLTNITNVFDNGVLLDGAEYTVDLGAGTITLLVNPDGQITCDAEGRRVFGSFTTKRGDFIYDMVTRIAGVDEIDFDVNSLISFNLAVSGTSGIYISSQASVLDTIQSLLRPVIGSLVFDRSGIASVHTLSIPDVNSPVTIRLNADQIIPGDAASDESVNGVAVSTRASDLLYYKVSLQYDQNLTLQTEDAIGVSGVVNPDTAAGRARRAWLKDEWRTSVVEQTGATTGKNLYPTAIELQPFPSYFFDKPNADYWAFQWLSIFGTTRKLTTIKGKMLPLRSQLYSVIVLTYRWFNNTPTIAVAYQEDYGQNEIQLTVMS